MKRFCSLLSKQTAELKQLPGQIYKETYLICLDKSTEPFALPQPI